MPRNNNTNLNPDGINNMNDITKPEVKREDLDQMHAEENDDFELKFYEMEMNEILNNEELKNKKIGNENKFIYFLE